MDIYHSMATQISELWENVVWQYQHLNLRRVLCGNWNIWTGKNSVGQCVHLNWEKCCVAVQTSEFGKRRYVAMKVLN